MSRFKRFARSLASGYVLLGANILFTLASVPLALKYLGTAEFGLWALATKIGGFIALVDFGMSASVARILIDHKDDRANGGYGSIVKTGLLVGITQGALVLVTGIILACFMGPWLEVPARLQPALQWLLIGQCSLLAVSFATKTFSHLLTAHQRFDITNYAQTILFAVGFVVMWLGFVLGQGVFSILWAYVATTFPQVAVNWISCVRLGLLPRHGEWGRLTWARFKTVFTFGSDIFIFALGAQLITASQTILLTRLIGLEAVTVWSICTRIYEVLLQIIYRFFDYSSSAFAEMMVRGEKALLAVRFRQIVILSASLSVAAGTLFAVSNNAFVKLWTSGRFESPTLLASDIKTPKLLAERLLAQRDAAAQFVWQQFPAATREELATLVTDEAATASLQSTLATALNRLVQSDSPLPLANLGVVTNESTPSPNLTDRRAGAWFNRHLLEDAFPQEIADSRKARWSPWNDLLLAVWLVICVSLHAHTGLVGQAKAFGFMRYIFFLEGLTFVGLTILLHRYGGITAMLCVSVACSLMFSFAYGLHRTRKYFGLSWRELAAWHGSAGRLALWVVPWAAAVCWVTRQLPPTWVLTLNCVLVGPWTLCWVLRCGLDASLQGEVLKHAPARTKSWLRRLMGSRTPQS